MTHHYVLIGVTTRAIKIHSLTCGDLTLYLHSQSSTCSCTFSMIELPLEKILVVYEYIDIFLDELLSMPLDRDIDFAIELQPGTTHIYKRPYRMPPAKLAELKKQLQELLDKGFIFPST